MEDVDEIMDEFSGMISKAHASKILKDKSAFDAELKNSRSNPRASNVSEILDFISARKRLNESGDYTMRVSGAIYNIDEVSSDINLPPQARTVLWNILNMLESIKD